MAMERGNDVQVVPLVRSLQRIVLYETKSRFYLVGSNNTESRFRILKIDRTEPRQLILSDDDIVYSNKEVREIINRIDVGNRSKVGQKIGSGLVRTVSAFGVAGFVRFTEGYYIVLITRRRRVALIGPHSIYKVEDTSLLYIPNEECREHQPDEWRYVKTFQAIDLSSNFYFSYTYDLTHTLQHNVGLADAVASESSVGERICILPTPKERFVWNAFLLEPLQSVNFNWRLPLIHGFVDQSNICVFGKPLLLALIARRSNRYAGTRFLKRGATFEGDVANEVETEQVVGDMCVSDLRHGNISSFVQIRGSVPAHWAQDITKMVPKPQIFFELQDPLGLTSGRHFDYLMRSYGSPIVVFNLVKKREKNRKHEVLLEEEFFRQVEYLNLFLPERFHINYVHIDMARLKKRESSAMATLGSVGSFAVRQTGIFHNRPSTFCLANRHISKKRLDAVTNAHIEKVSNTKRTECLRQSGVVRTNCVDCLDRTNIAQFVIAKAALALQLYAMGLRSSSLLDYESDCTRMLESMYEDHGDTLALQYGGSQLTHRIRSYRKGSKWTSRASDITQTLRRYYSNTLSDAEKQNAINVFLGTFRPVCSNNKSGFNIWEKDFSTDHYLHLKDLRLHYGHPECLLSRQEAPWWDESSLSSTLPFPLLLEGKAYERIDAHNQEIEAGDLYEDCYRPNESTVLAEAFTYKLCHSVRDVMPNASTDFSPFVVRDRSTQRREESVAITTPTTNPLLAFFRGSVSSTSTSNEADESIGSEPRISSIAGSGSAVSAVLKYDPNESDEEEVSNSEDFDWLDENEVNEEASCSSDVFDAPNEDIAFGDDEHNRLGLWKISPRDMMLYSRYATICESCRSSSSTSVSSVSMLSMPEDVQGLFSLPSPIDECDLAEMSLDNLQSLPTDVYEKFVDVETIFKSKVNQADLQCYTSFLANSC